MQILGLFGIYFDAVVVEVKTFSFIQTGSGHSAEYCGLDFAQFDAFVVYLK